MMRTVRCIKLVAIVVLHIHQQKGNVSWEVVQLLWYGRVNGIVMTVEFSFKPRKMSS